MHIHKISHRIVSNADLYSGDACFSGVDNDLSVLAGGHNADTVRLHVEMFLTTELHFTVQHVFTTLERRRRVAATDTIRVQRTLVKRALRNRLLANRDRPPNQYPQIRGGSRKKYWRGAGPPSFERQQRLSEVTIEPITSNMWKS